MCSSRCSSASERPSCPLGGMTAWSASIVSVSCVDERARSPSRDRRRTASGATSVVGSPPSVDDLLDQVARVVDLLAREAAELEGERLELEAGEAAGGEGVGERGAVLQGRAALSASIDGLLVHGVAVGHAAPSTRSMRVSFRPWSAKGAFDGGAWRAVRRCCSSFGRFEPPRSETRGRARRCPLDHAAARRPEAATSSYVHYRARRRASGGHDRLPRRRARRGGRPPAPTRSPAALGALRDTYDIVFFDQRGTGALLAAALLGRRARPLRSRRRRHAEAARASTACATSSAPTRRFFSTYETALDLEDLRASPRRARRSSRSASPTAARWPASTRGASRTASQALVLDSTSPIEGVDASARLPQLALPRVLREVCFPPGCERMPRRPAARLDRVARTVRERPCLRPHGAAPRPRCRPLRADPRVGHRPAAAHRAAGGAPGRGARRRGAAAAAARATREARAARRAASTRSASWPPTCIEGRLPWAPDSDPAAAAGAARRAR